MVHELGDSKRQVRIVDEGRLRQAAPLVADLRPCLDLYGLGQDDGLSLGGRASTEDGHDEEVTGIDGEVEALDGEDVRSLPERFDPGVGDAEGLELNRSRVIMLGGGGGIPGDQAAGIGGGDSLAVQIGDETIVVHHAQGELRDVRGIVDLEGNPNIDAGVSVVHLALDVDIDEPLVAFAALVADADPVSAEEPGGIVEAGLGPASSKASICRYQRPHTAVFIG